MTDIVTPPTIPTMPPAPVLTDTQADFNSKAFATVQAWPNFITQTNGAASATQQNATASQERATSANTSALSAANSATSAGGARDMAQAFAQSAVNAPSANGTSLSVAAVSAGTKTFWTQAGKAWISGQSVIVARASALAAVRMYAVILGYNTSTGELVVDVPAGAFMGSGTYSDWVISLTATREGLVRQGAGPAQLANELSIGWSVDSRVRISVGGVDLGPIALLNSDVYEASPPGKFGLFFQSAVPPGWLKANGAAVSRTAYARLFAVIGTYYGAGDGSTTFNVPEMRGTFPRTWDDARGVDPGRAFGSYQAPANLSHNHGGATHDAGWHNHAGITDGAGSHGHTGTALNAGGHVHSNQQTRSAGGGGGPNSFKSEDSAGSAMNSSYAGEHTHALSLSVEGYHGHNLYIDGNGLHGHGLNPDGVGESRPHNVALMGCIRY